MVSFLSNRITRIRIKQKSTYTPRWIVYLMDMILSVLALGIATLILNNFQFNDILKPEIIRIVGVVMSVRLISFLIGKTYSGIIRYTGTEDVLRIFYVLTIGEIVLLMLNVFFYYFANSFYIPLSFLLVEYVMLMCLMIVSRIFIKITFAQYFNAESDVKNVIICGSDEYGMMAKHALDNSVDASYNIIAFIDIDGMKANKILEGVKIYKLDVLPELLDKHHIEKVIIAKKVIVPEKKKYIIEACLQHQAEILEVPVFKRWISGDLNVRHIRSIKIEDLLNRGVIELDEMVLRKQILNKTILVTGAAGSIGSEIVRQLTKFKPAKIVLFDQNESPLYDIELELSEVLLFKDFSVEIGDIREFKRLEEIFLKYSPDIVYHAAAYKHVPMIELHPVEGVKTNVMGTKNVADLAVKYGCQRFVMISTDKAVNPTNVMGATKRIAEMYIQSLNSRSNTNFITTRFGNVLGSNGSVIPRFAKQIENGGPVTVTHPEITRYFMTIPEACLLVLQAGALGAGGEIFIFDMGEGVKIVDLARKMIRLSGFEIGRDIQIVFTGLRPGEKLYEELLNVAENTLPTPHERIKRAKVREYSYEEVKEMISDLLSDLTAEDGFEVVRKMKIMVPEFKSKNSIYETIDFELEEQEAPVAVECEN